jgi:hypothetical protein
VSALLELGDEPAGRSFGIAFREIVAAGVSVDLAGGEDVPGGDEHRVRDGGNRAGVPTTSAESVVLGLEVVLECSGVFESFDERWYPS